MRLCDQQKQEYFDFANRILFGDFETTKSRCLASLDNSGKLLGVVIFDRFTIHSCELNVASISPRFLTKDLILATFDYIFNVCGKIRITTIVSSDNHKSLALQRGLGFVEEARLKSFYGDHDGIVFRMLRQECIWIAGNSYRRRGNHDRKVHTH